MGRAYTARGRDRASTRRLALFHHNCEPTQGRTEKYAPMVTAFARVLATAGCCTASGAGTKACTLCFVWVGEWMWVWVSVLAASSSSLLILMGLWAFRWIPCTY